MDFFRVSSFELRASALALLLIFLPSANASAEEWVLAPEGKFWAHKVSRPIEGAQATVLAVSKGGEFPTPEQWAATAMTDEALLAQTRRLGAQWLREIEPELVRNPRKVIQYAVLRSDKVPVCATVLAPEFWAKFEPLFGPKMLVVMPNRNTVLIFPPPLADAKNHGPLVMEFWRSHSLKLSLEVFELTEKGLRAAGAFEEP